jgi:parvulin-like peptidyl-prolyl isomerase
MLRAFGADLAPRLMALEPGRWSGPFTVGEGCFLARLDERVAGTQPAFELIEARARRALEQERRQRALTQALLRLRTSYAIEVADRPIRTARAGPAPQSFVKGMAR